MLNSVDEVVKALGGNAAVASLTGVTIPAVHNWLKRGRISQGRFMIIRDELASSGQEAAPSVFGFKEAVAAEDRA
jgi:hypothetical protein